MASSRRSLTSLSFALSTLVVAALLSALISEPVWASRRHKSTSGRHSSTRAASHSKKRASRHQRKSTVAAKPRYAYPLDFFMLKAPWFDKTPLESGAAHYVQNAFSCGTAQDYSAPQLVQAGVFHHYPLSGGIFWRREPVKYIVLHSTETGVPVPAKNVINSWSSMGRRHPGAQFVVERDGTIYLAVDPDLGTVHVNIFKTLPGINNDNSIGIEMNHTGRQDYPAEQRSAVVRLVTYLQHRFNVTSDNVITHKYAQQGDHTDPVHFDLENFLAIKEDFRLKALAIRREYPAIQVATATRQEPEKPLPLASIYVQIHGPIKLAGTAIQSKTSLNKTGVSAVAELP